MEVNPMNDIVIKTFTPDLLEDYLNFFDNDAFADNPDWSACYCTWFHFDHTKCDFNKTTAEQNRSAIIERIKNNKMYGYLAYSNSKPIAWLNAGSKQNYTVVPKTTDDEKYKIAATVCFTIAKDYRKKGIARQLLDRACADFKKQNYDIIEGYPLQNTNRDDHNYHGPYSLFISGGFELFDTVNDQIILRKYLAD